jgi:hypothetical protein
VLYNVFDPTQGTHRELSTGSIFVIPPAPDAHAC